MLTTSDTIHHKCDNAEQVFFYEQEFYPLSNFSSFNLLWKGIRFHTSEVAYHWEKFPDRPDIQQLLLDATSAHDAYQVAAYYKEQRRPDWDEVKVVIMLKILWAKVHQHAYVKKKLLETGTRTLIEDAWRDSFWGWGSDKNGKNILGLCWMLIRDLLSSPSYSEDLSMCNHFFVSGFGGMGDAVVCTKCGLDKYPESITAAYLLAKIQGRVIEESHPEWAKYAEEAKAARAAREKRESANHG